MARLRRRRWALLLRHTGGCSGSSSAHQRGGVVREAAARAAPGSGVRPGFAAPPPALQQLRVRPGPRR
eukprot:13366583-Alexandrium_andersonii.AAC.1